jgi:hypothetical protein
MPDITVQRHGDRWAVIPAGAESPTEEHESREAAELSARALADGGTIEVREDDPSHLDEADETSRGSDATRSPMPAERIPRAFEQGL